MSLSVVFVIIGVIIVAVILLLVLLTMGGGGAGAANQAASNNLRTLVVAQRHSAAEQSAGRGKEIRGDKAKLALAAAAEGELGRKQVVSAARMTLEKKLSHARWPITPLQYRAIQVFVCIALLIPAYLQATIYIQILCAVMGPLLVGEFLLAAMNKRFLAFDEDYPVLLLSYVSLLRTGMSTITGLEAAAKGLDHDSMVRAEVELLIERLRLGLTEEQAIGAFGEDIPHPELELFVQSLILSKRVGGTLSLTLERLSKQVRKRQQFRKQAVAAVAMERSSIWVIAAIMALLLLYLVFTSPLLILPALSHPLGKKIFQCGIMFIVFGFYWSRKVTEVKV